MDGRGEKGLKSVRRQQASRPMMERVATVRARKKKKKTQT